MPFGIWLKECNQNPDREESISLTKLPRPVFPSFSQYVGLPGTTSDIANNNNDSLIFVQSSGSQRVLPGWAAAASPGNL